MSPGSGKKENNSYRSDHAFVPSPGNSNSSSDSAIESLGGSPPPENAPTVGRRRKPVDKDSEQYKARRERNNEAVRKSRAKSKFKRQQTDNQLRQLQNDKSNLELQVEVLQKELSLIRSWVKREPSTEMDGQGISHTFSVGSGGLK